MRNGNANTSCFIRGLLNVSVQENAYKIRTRWHKVPKLLHRNTPMVQTGVGITGRSMDHSFIFGGPAILLQNTGKHSIKQFYSWLATVDFTLLQYLLHFNNQPLKANKKSLAAHINIAAHMCIPVYWIDTRSPSIWDWYSRLRKVAEMEDWIHISQDRMTFFLNAWACWLHFQTTDSYKQVMAYPRATTMIYGVAEVRQQDGC